jgi:peptidoglycan/LPS O-acetylase OafA/YrhL
MRHCHLFPRRNFSIMPPSATPTLRVEALDLLRLVAVLGVVLYHFGFWGPASHGVPQVALPWLTPVAKYGFLGVSSAAS